MFPNYRHKRCHDATDELQTSKRDRGYKIPNEQTRASTIPEAKDPTQGNKEHAPKPSNKQGWTWSAPPLQLGIPSYFVDPP